MTKHHLHFHLGPAGGFIDEARRTRDYWAGSFLLSWLTGKAMSAASPKREEIILPVVQEEVEGASGASLRALLRTWVVRIIDERTFLVDPTLAAIAAAAETKTGVLGGPFLGTLTNHFTAEFNTRRSS
jgi:hypothetical protein